MGNPFLDKKSRKGAFVLLIYRLVGKSLSALISASFQNLSSCGGSHSLTEAVYFALLSFLGLISSFHNLFS